MSLGRWSWKGATGEWSENIFCWIKLRSALLPLCLSDLNLNCWVNVFPAFIPLETDEAIDVIECCQTEQGGDEARPWTAGCFVLCECTRPP